MQCHVYTVMLHSIWTPEEGGIRAPEASPQVNTGKFMKITASPCPISSPRELPRRVHPAPFGTSSLFGGV